MNYYIGTMGFSYKDWAGVLYPENLPSRDYLSYYSHIFNAAEIDSTFYGTPKADTVRRWEAVTPEQFRFCVKAPREVTHDLSLVGAMGLMTEFVRTMRLLGEKLGVVLLQFPPSFGADRLGDLSAFLAELPAGTRYAVEIRQRSWYESQEQTAEALARHGVCWASTQYPGLPRSLNLTADFAYIRWIGQHGSFDRHDHERLDRTEELKAWWELIQAAEGKIDTVYGFTNNDYAGFAAATANRFKEIAGIPVEPLGPPQQGKLF